MATRICLLSAAGGQLDLTGSGAAILLGVDIQELSNLVGDGRDVTALPAHWHQVGRRRAAEAQAHTESTHPADLVGYWALKRWGTRVSLTTDDTGLWLITEDHDVARALADKAIE